MPEDYVDGHYPIHKDLPKVLDGMREIGVAYFLYCVVVIFPIVRYGPTGSGARMVLLILAFLSGLLVAALVARRLARKRDARRAEAERDFHEMMETHRSRQMAEAKASGAFDRFGGGNA